MKLLKSENNQGFFYKAPEEYVPVDKITKDDLLRLVNLTLDKDKVDFDEFNPENIKNHAHQIIYKNLYEKLKALQDRRQEFKDEVGRAYLADYEKYRSA